MRALTLGIFLAATATAAYAQCDGLPPIGTVYTCAVLPGGGKVLVVNGKEEPVESTVRATFRVTGYTSNPCAVVLENIAFSSSSISLTLGEFNTYTSPGGSSGATITQNGEGKSLLPATLNIALNLTANVGGKEFKSDVPLQLQNTDVQSLDFKDLKVEQSEKEVTFSDGNTEIGLRSVGVALQSSGKGDCEGLPPIGTTYHCEFTPDGNSVKTIVVEGDRLPSSSSGNAVFTVIGYTSNPCAVILENRSFQSESKDERLGSVLTYTNPKRAFSGATITQLDPESGKLFPASLEIQLNLQSKVSSYDRELTANRPLILRSKEIESFEFKDVRVSQRDREAVTFTSDDRKLSVGLIETNVTLNSK
jgi:hypothetical protein